MSQWFRMYAEVLEDPKVQRLSGDDFKAWVNLLCLTARLDGTLPPLEDVAFALRSDLKKVSATVARLVAAGLIVSNETGMKPHKWDDRQYKSDVSTSRVKRFRERFKQQTETVTVTPPETDTETEVPLAKAKGADPDSDTEFWASAKTFVGGTNPGALIGKWCRDFGKVETAQAITRAQVERPVERVAFITGTLRKATNNGYGPGHSGVPL